MYDKFHVQREDSFFGIFSYWTEISRHANAFEATKAIEVLMGVDEYNSKLEDNWQQKSSTSKDTKKQEGKSTSDVPPNGETHTS